jgi:hypothetical protein
MRTVLALALTGLFAQAGELVQVVTFAGLPTVDAVRAALARNVGPIGWPQPFPPAPVFALPPLLRGGFGGGRCGG